MSWELERKLNVKNLQGDIEGPRNYAALLEYYKEHRTCNIPSTANYKCDIEGLGENGCLYHYVGNLGRWLHRQRQAKKGQVAYKILPYRLALLQKLVDEGMCECVCLISSCN